MRVYLCVEKGEGGRGMDERGWRKWLLKNIPLSDQGLRKGLGTQIWTQSLPSQEPGGAACGVFQQLPGIVHTAELTGRKSMVATEM